MKIILYLVGKTKTPYLQMAEHDFAKRIQGYCELEIITVKEEKVTRHKTEAAIKAAEAKRIIEKLDRNAKPIILESRGKHGTSEEFADYFKEGLDKGVDKFAFIIGGVLGLPDDFLSDSATRLSLSRMTFTHEMCRVILLEQIYRAFTILRNEKYHK